MCCCLTRCVALLLNVSFSNPMCRWPDLGSVLQLVYTGNMHNVSLRMLNLENLRKNNSFLLSHSGNSGHDKPGANYLLTWTWPFGIVNGAEFFPSTTTIYLEQVSCQGYFTHIPTNSGKFRFNTTFTFTVPKTCFWCSVHAHHTSIPCNVPADNKTGSSSETTCCRNNKGRTPSGVGWNCFTAPWLE